MHKFLDCVRTQSDSVYINTRSIKMFKFSKLAYAQDFIYKRATKPMGIIMGDDCRFWVVTPARAMKLVSQGYELVH